MAQQRVANIRAIFVEKDPTAFRALEYALQQHRGAVTTTALLGTFQDNIPAILRQVGTSFAFFFIDPKGWTGFAMDNIRPILRHRPGEVMVNFMYDFINRFINYPDSTNEQSLDRFFGTTHWRDIRNTTDREDASVDLYKEQLRATGAHTYVTSTGILKPLHNRAYFHLIYATRNPKGILKFRDVEKHTVKEQDTVRAAAQRTHRESTTGQAELAFGPSAEISTTIQLERRHRLNQAKGRLLHLIRQGPIPYEALQPLILEHPLVWNSDFNTLLLEAQQEGSLIIGGMTARERTPKRGHLIRSKP
jgi:three-Cys-motif partner protein